MPVFPAYIIPSVAESPWLVEVPWVLGRQQLIMPTAIRTNVPSQGDSQISYLSYGVMWYKPLNKIKSHDTSFRVTSTAAMQKYNFNSFRWTHNKMGIS